MTKQNGWCGHVLNISFVAGLLEQGPHTHVIHLLRVNWCYTSVSQEKQALLSLPITLGGSNARREKLQPSEDSVLPFIESEKNLRRQRFHVFPRAQISFLEGVLFSTEQVTKENWRPSSLCAISLHSDFTKVNNLREAKFIHKEIIPAFAEESQETKLNARGKPKHRAIWSMKGWFPH